MLFGKGSWSIFGLKPESLMKFKLSMVQTPGNLALFSVSQLKASLITKFQNKATVGINPFASPRLDETLVDPLVLQAVGKILDPDNSQPSADSLPGKGLIDQLVDFYGANEAAFKIGQDDQSHYYGFWAVFNDFDDVTDVASKKEALAYTNVSRPYKFLNKEEKKGVDSFVQATNVLTRKQFPVLMDFIEGRVYAATTNVEEVGWVQSLIEALGGECFSLCWNFDNVKFPSLFLDAIRCGTKPVFLKEMEARASELTRFTKKEIVKLDDKIMEKIVSNYFAITELETGRWAALKGPSKIKLSASGDPITCAGPSEAFALLGLDSPWDNSIPAAATVVFQELTSKFKKEVEYQVRNDLFSLVLDDNVNLQDAGAALLKGFDVPGFKQDVMRQIKESKSELPIAKYWDTWLRKMRGAIAIYIDDMTETLKIDKQAFGLKKYESESEEAITV
jgi:hypothetical protein